MKTLKTQQEYHHAMAQLERIFATARPGTSEGEEFERLTALTSIWDREHGGPGSELEPGTPVVLALGCTCVQEGWGWKETGCPVHS